MIFNRHAFPCIHIAMSFSYNTLSCHSTLFTTTFLHFALTNIILEKKIADVKVTSSEVTTFICKSYPVIDLSSNFYTQDTKKEVHIGPCSNKVNIFFLLIGRLPTQTVRVFPRLNKSHFSLKFRRKTNITNRAGYLSFERPISHP